MRYYYILSVLLLLSSYVFSQQNESKYDVAAYIWPAYQDDPRFKEMNVFPDGKGEWEAIYKAKPKFEGHRQPRVPLWGYLD